ncbi:MAG: RluA family pseudouridine synthase [Pseudomonadota bacterium]
MAQPELTPEKQFHQVQHVEVDASAAGQRIDNFLMRLLKSAPRSLVYRLLRTGQVRVNKGRAKPSMKLNAGDVVRIPPMTLATANTVHLPAGAISALEQSIVREDDHWIFINKPEGLAVHAGTGVNFGVIDLAQRIFDDKNIALVHRLDRETSGCLVLARNRIAAVHFQQCLRNGTVRKRYTAMVAGKVAGSFREDAPLQKNQPQDGERMVVVDHRIGKSAVSHFSPACTGEASSIVDVEIETGRTHQIRVHAAHRGHPILGDARYGDRNTNKRLVATLGKRMYLHAAQISFPKLDGSGAEPDIGLACEVKDEWQALHKMINS